MEMVNVKINNMPVSVPQGSTILDAAKLAGIDIPTLCYMREMNEIGACRICVVEVKGARSLVASCVHPVSEGMEIFTNSPRVQKSRKISLELILSNHDRKCLSCFRSGSGNCELQALCHEFGVDDEGHYDGERQQYPVERTPYIIRDNNKCILCRRCEAACREQHVGVIGPNARGFDTHIGCAFEKNLADVPCVACGQCLVNCPTGALVENDEIDPVFNAIADPDKIVIAFPAPSIRVTLGESFGMPVGSNVKGKMVAAMRRLGFDKVFDTDFGADLTIMEEANELIERIQSGGVLPMITSCSPGWIQYCEAYYPELIPHLSSCKSPQQMTGAVVKTYYAQKHGLDPKKIVTVSIIPCTAKKVEADLDGQSAAGKGIPDVDFALTTRELARMISRSGIAFTTLPDEEFDATLDVSTGAGAIFGATGGVMEAALRTAADLLTGEDLKQVDYNEVRGTEKIKEAVYNIAGMDVKVAVTSGLKNASVILDKIKDGTADYHFIEIMCCPGGCVNGGGQPMVPASVRNFIDLKAVRAASLYEEDANLTFRKSHDSPVIKKVYDEFFEKPGSHKAHEILHTTYTPREKY